MEDFSQNIPEVVEEIRALFERYEKALIENDVDILDKIPDYAIEMGLSPRLEVVTELASEQALSDLLGALHVRGGLYFFNNDVELNWLPLDGITAPVTVPFSPALLPETALAQRDAALGTLLSEHLVPPRFRHWRLTTGTDSPDRVPDCRRS